MNRLSSVLLLASLSITPLVRAQSGQPTSNANVWRANASTVNGVAPGYWPRAGSGLVLNIGRGTAYCTVLVQYAGGTLTLAANATNYVYLNAASSCVPSTKTTPFGSGDIPIATVVTGATSITLLTDVRTHFTAGAQVNADWNSIAGASLILNKPVIPAAQVNSNWTAVSGLAQILNKPTIPNLAAPGPIGATTPSTGAFTTITAGNLGTAAAANTTGSGAAVVTGPTTTVTAHCANFANTTGQIADSGAACNTGSSTVIPGTVNQMVTSNGGGGAAVSTATLDSAGNLTMVPGSGAAISAPIVSGVRHPSGYGSIAATVGAGQLTQVDPNYSTADTYNWNAFASMPQNAEIIDYRFGTEFHFIHDWNPSRAAHNGEGTNAGYSFNCLNDVTSVGTPSYNGHHNCATTSLISTSPGLDHSSVSQGQSGWDLTQGLAINTTVNGDGITEAFLVNQKKFGNGDNIAAYFYNDNSGGAIAGSDEGSKVASFNQSDVSYAPFGTVASCNGNGATALATISGGVITAITPVVPGLGYTSAAVAITGGGGTGGAATANITTSSIGSYTLTNGGSGYTSVPTVTVTSTSSTCATGSTAVVMNMSRGSGDQGTGRTLIWEGAGSIPATIVSSGSFSRMSLVTVSGTPFPVSNAWGKTPNVNTPFNQVFPFTTSETFTVTGISGTGFDTTHLMCFADFFQECEIPTAVGTLSGGSQSVTVPLRNALLVGGDVFQGGMAGYSFESPAFTYTTGQPYRYVHTIFGSTSSNTIIAGDFGSSLASTLYSFTGDMFGVQNLSACTNSGTTTISCTMNPVGSTAPTNTYKYWQGMTINITDATNPSMSGVCSNVAVTTAGGTSSSFTCTHTGLSGTYGPDTATAINMNIAGTYNMADIIAYPSAYVFDVQDESNNPPTADGTFNLDPNIIPFTSGGTIEEPHAMVQFNAVATMNEDIRNPYSGNQVLQWRYTGSAGVGQNTSLVNVQLSNPSAVYPIVGYGGIQNPPTVFKITGALGSFVNTAFGPVSGGDFMTINSTAIQNADPNYNFNVFSVNGLNTKWAYTGKTSANTITSSGPFSLISPTSVIIAGTNNAIATGTTINGSGGLLVDAAVSGGGGLTVRNPTNTTLGYAYLNLTAANNDLTYGLHFNSTSPGFTTAGVLQPRMNYIGSGSNDWNGFMINTETNSAGSNLTLATFNTPRMVFAPTGGVSVVTPMTFGTGGSITLPNTAVTAGSYTNPTLAIGADGRVTSAANGSTTAGVSSIDTLTGAFTFAGTGVSHVGNAYTFNAGTCPTCLLGASLGPGILHVPGASQTATSSLIDLTADVVNVLPVTSGGTGSTTGPVQDVAVTVASTLVGIGACTSDITVSMPNLATTQGVDAKWSSTTEVGVTGWDQSQPHVTIQARPTSVGVASYHLCNASTNPAITTAAYTFNFVAE